MKQTGALRQTPPQEGDEGNEGEGGAASSSDEQAEEALLRSGSLAQATPTEKITVCNTLAAMFYGVSSEDFEAHTRHERWINEARQLGMYLANTCLSVDYEEIGRVSRRDRTTVRYSIERVEDRRENPQFDSVLIAFETVIGCFQDREVADMIEKGLQIDHDIIAYVPKAG